MASLIRIKRSSVAGNPTTLAAGELAYSALPDNGSNGGERLYIGIGTETNGNAANHYVVGGKYFTDSIDAATSANTANTIIKRDANGDFAAGTITATRFSGAIDGAGIDVNSVTLGTQTTGNYLATLADAGNSNLVVVGSGSETAAVTLDLSDTGVTGGQYGSATAIPQITVDAKGRVTAAGTINVATSLSVNAESGTGDGVDLLTDSLTINGDASHLSTSITGDTVTISSDATELNTASTIVARDASGNFSAGTITANLTGNVTGDVTGDITGDVTSSNVIISGGSIDTTMIGAVDPAYGAFTTLQATTPSFTGNLDMNSNNIVNVAEPTQSHHAATKSYVDAVKTGLDVKDSVKVATTENIALDGTQASVDGVALTDGDRVLVKNQTDQTENGIYVVSTSGNWSRSTDADNNPGNEVSGGMFTFVESGTVNADSGWVLSNVTGNAVLGTDSLQFSQFSGAGQIIAGIALSKTGNTIDVNVSTNGGLNVNGSDQLELDSNVSGAGLTLTNGVIDVVGTANRITVNANDIDIASTYVGQTSITTLGTIDTGTWEGTTIAAGYGGTGLSSYTVGDLVYASGATTLAKLAMGNAGTVLQVNSAGSALTYGDLDGGTY